MPRATAQSQRSSTPSRANLSESYWTSRLEAELPAGDEIILDMPISIYGGG